MTSKTTPKNTRRKKAPKAATTVTVTPPPSTPASGSKLAPIVSPITATPEDETFSSLQNPNRFTLPKAEEIQATRLINPNVIDLDTASRRRTSGRKQLTTITIIGIRGENTKRSSLQVEGTHSIGLCIRDGEKMRFMHYPTLENLDDVLPSALETAIMYVPALSDVIISSPHRMIRDNRNHTPETAERIRDFGLNVNARHPLPGDVGATLARMSAMGITGPLLVDYHLYTASITDESRSYAAALLWGKHYALQFIQTFEDAKLSSAEAHMAEWAFKLLPQGAEVMVHNANPGFGEVWKNPKILALEENAALREAMRGLGKQLRIKNIVFDVKKEKPHELLKRAVRDIAAGRYAAADTRRTERPETRSARKRQ